MAEDSTFVVKCAVSLKFPDSTTQTVNAQSPTVIFMKPTPAWTVNVVPPYLARPIPPREVPGFYSDNAFFMQAYEWWDPIQITDPTGFSGGMGCLAQITTPNRTNTRIPTGTGHATYTLKIEVPPGSGTWVAPGTGLDGMFPYPKGLADDGFGHDGNPVYDGYMWDISVPGHSQDIPDLDFAQPAAGDNGGQNWTYAKTADQFSTWLMFRPPANGSQGTIWVPLQTLSWNWGGTANGSGTLWTVTSPSSLLAVQWVRIFHRVGPKLSSISSSITEQYVSMLRLCEEKEMKLQKTQKLLTITLPLAGAASLLMLPVLTSSVSAQKPMPSSPTQKPTAGTTHFLSKLRPLNHAVSQALGDSYNFAFAGDAAMKLGNWKEAQSDYQEALEIIPNNMPALHGMAKCAEQVGNTADALKYYRLDIYSHDPARYGTVPGDGFQENDVQTLMRYAILLSRAGQEHEAVTIYNRAANLLNYDQGHQNLKVLLPEIVAERALPNPVCYTPERLQALADTAIAHEEMGFGSNKEAIAHMKEAAKQYPDSAAIQYYLGEALSGSYYVYLDSPVKDKAAAWAAFQEDKKATPLAYKKAVELGDDATVAAAKERLSIYP